MGLSIHTNYASLVTQSQLNSTNKSLSTAMQRLGTGLRINSAADDAAGLQIATRLQAQSNGQKVGMSNAQDAISMLQTAEGAMEEMTNIVQRMKDLATQAANGTNSTTDISAMDSEYKNLQDELKNITDNTTFAGKSLLEATSGKFTAAVKFQIGGKSSETMEVDVTAALSVVTSSTSLSGTSGALTSATASGLIDSLGTLLDNIGTVRSAFGANINRLDHTINNLSNMKENTDTAKGRIMDADYAAESSSMTKNQMLLQSGISVLSNSNQMTSLVTSLLR